MKKLFLKISQISQENTWARDFFLIKLQACNFIKKESLTQVFSREFCEISKNTLFYRTPSVTASESSKYLTKEMNLYQNKETWNRSNTVCNIFH